jgi:glycosyltransferase involved in cell wall biosynthesis
MEIQCQRLSHALTARGHSVTVLTERTSNARAPVSREDGVDVLRFPTLGWPPFSTFLYCIQVMIYLIQHREFDLIHAHMVALPALTGLRIGRLLHKPVLIKSAGAGATGDLGTSHKHWYGGWKLAAFKKNAQYVVCPSEETLREFQELGLPAERLYRIPNGIDTNRFRPATDNERAQTRDHLKLPADRLLAIYAGRWAPGKGVERLLEIWQKAFPINDFGWNLVLLLAAGESAAQLESARLSALGTRLHIFHNVSDPAPFYRASDLAILLSDAEGISNFLLEAMSSGLPCLTTAPAAITADPARDTWSWIAGNGAIAENALALLQQLQADPLSLRTKGAAGRKNVEENYGMDKIVGVYESLYQTMLKGSN